MQLFVVCVVLVSVSLHCFVQKPLLVFFIHEHVFQIHRLFRENIDSFSVPYAHSRDRCNELRCGKEEDDDDEKEHL